MRFDSKGTNTTTARQCDPTICHEHYGSELHSYSVSVPPEESERIIERNWRPGIRTGTDKVWG